MRRVGEEILDWFVPGVLYRNAKMRQLGNICQWAMADFDMAMDKTLTCSVHATDVHHTVICVRGMAVEAPLVSHEALAKPQ